jgi:hypothetical protein
VDRCHQVHDVGVGDSRLDHHRAEEAAAHLLVRDLVRAVPVRAGILGDEAVDVLAALLDCVLRHPGHAVLGVGHVHAVPVEGCAVGDRLIDERDLDEVTLGRPDLRTRRRAVEGVAVDQRPVLDLHRLLSGDQRH